jgi:hypothetical protein
MEWSIITTPSIHNHSAGLSRVAMMQLASTSMESLMASVGFQLRQGKSIVTLYMGICAALYNGTIQ